MRNSWPVGMKRNGLPITVGVLLSLTGCASAPNPVPGTSHLMQTPAPSKAAGIPAPVMASPVLSAPKPAPKTETYSVSVRNIPAQELLFALSRDAKLNIDLHPGIQGTVTINAIDQTLPQILSRVAKQVDMRWEVDGPNLIIQPDTPLLRNYRVDYVNIARDVRVTTEVNSQVSPNAPGSGTTGPSTTTRIESASKNTFWATLEKNIKDLLRETDKIMPDGSSETTIENNESKTAVGSPIQDIKQVAANGKVLTQGSAQAGEGSVTKDATTTVKRVTYREAASVIANPESGVIAVRATSRQHEKIQEYIDLITNNARRQVMIEATIVEVQLNKDYQQGINWRSLRSARGGSAGFSIAQGSDNLVNGIDTLKSSGGILLNYVSPGLGLSATVQLLEDFGNVKVLSSPKISVLNNQTAVIKVVDNLVYFTIKSDTTTSSAGTGQTTVTTTPNSVAVGLVMGVTPQINDGNSIILNVRPTISRLTGYVDDPNPNIPPGSVNRVPEIATREMESMLRLTDGQIAIMGGLMSDAINNNASGIPGLSGISGLTNLFTSFDNKNSKSELVIFIKPTIIRDPSIEGDYKALASALPGDNFFGNNPGPQVQQLKSGAATQ